MTDQPSVVVVGAGAIGLCTAFELHELGVRDVTVIEKRHVASASSGLAVGIIETQYLDPVPIAIRVYAMDFFARLEREAGLTITRNGYLRLAHGEQDLGVFERSARCSRSSASADATVLDRDQVARARAGHGLRRHPRRAVRPERRLRRSGADVQPDSPISSARRGVTIAQQTELVGATRRRGWRHVLETTAGPLRCDHVVNAAGAWATPRRRAARRARCACCRSATRRCSRVCAEPLGYVMPSVMDYIPGSGRHGLYFRHDSPTALVAGLHTEDALHGIVDPDRYRRGGDDLAYMVGRRRAARASGCRRSPRPAWTASGRASTRSAPTASRRSARTRPPDRARGVRRRRLGLPVGAGHRPHASRSGSCTASRRTVPGVVELSPDRASVTTAEHLIRRHGLAPMRAPYVPRQTPASRDMGSDPVADRLPSARTSHDAAQSARTMRGRVTHLRGCCPTDEEGAPARGQSATPHQRIAASAIACAQSTRSSTGTYSSIEWALSMCRGPKPTIGVPPKRVNVAASNHESRPPTPTSRRPPPTPPARCR